MKPVFSLILTIKKIPAIIGTAAAFSAITGGFFILSLLNKPEPEFKKEKGPQRDRPDLAVLQDVERTKDPALGSVPYERLQVVRNIIKQQHAAAKNGNPSPLTVASWNERGPSNVGGRTRAMMFDPNDGTNKKFWTGGVAGGLWYTNDITVASPTWVSVNDFWANIAISTIAYDPSTPLTFYVGTGEGWFNSDAVRGDGIWKSTDGGATWAQLASTTGAPADYNFDYVNKIVVNSSGKIFAATRSRYSNRGGLMMSSDGGASWSKYVAGSVGGFDWCADAEIAANGDIYASFGIAFSNGIYKSTNNGTSWTQVYASGAGEERIELACAPSNNQVVYALFEASGTPPIRKTTNGGTSWSTLTNPTWYDQSCVTPSSDWTRGQDWYDLIAVVDPANENNVFIGGVDLFKTTNGGTSWSQITSWWGGCSRPYVHADQHALVFQPGSSSVLVSGNDGGVHYTSNATAATPSWTEKNSGYNVTQFYAGAIHPTAGQNYFLAGAQDNGSQKFDSPGIDATVEVTGGDGAFCFIDQTNANYQITSYVYNVYYRSTNGGASFSNILNDQSSGSFINPADYDDANGILYSAYSTTQINRISGIRGTPSTSQFTVSGMSSTARHIRVSPYSPPSTTTLFVGTGNGKVYKITNAQGTPSTTDISSGSFPASSISCIEIGASESELLVTFSNYGVTSVWYTTNGGSSWTSKENNLPDMPIRWALFNPNDYKEVLLATEVGVWSTDDITVASPVWAANNSGLSNCRIDMLQIRSSDNEVIAATHGRGLFSSDVFASCSIVVTMSKTDATCGNNNGTATATPSGGTSPYTYSWNPGGGTTQTISNLTAGTYTCTVTDNNSCTETGTVTVGTTGGVSLSMSKTDATCTSSNGSATATPSGGTSPYTYSWNPGGGTTQTISNLAAGTYTCNVTDAGGCTTTGTVTVGSTPCGPTKLQPAYCGITLTNLNDVMYCIWVSGATKYQYRVTHPSSGFTGYFTANNGTTTFVISWVSGVQYGKTYNVEVRAYTTSWSNWGDICTVTTPASSPLTQLQPAYCGITLTTLYQEMYCVIVPGATYYQYKVTNAASGFTGYFTAMNGTNKFVISWVSGVQYGKTYDVEVRSYVGGVWSSYGAVCTVTTPASSPLTQLQPAYCGITLTTLYQEMYCVIVPGATWYQYKVTHAASGFTGYFTATNGTNKFVISWVSGVQYGKTYDVEVRSYVGGVWSSYGAVCTVTTPASIPLTKLRPSDCGATLPAVSTAIYCNSVEGATNYQYRVTDSGGFNATYYKNSSLTDFRLSWLSGTTINHTYKVVVRAYVGGVWGSYGDTCLVTTGPVLRLSDDDDEVNYSLLLHPNPVSESPLYFNIEGAIAGEEALIEIYNLLGEKLYSEKITYTGSEAVIHLDQSFLKGIYFMTAIINNRKLYRKFVVLR